MIDFPAYYLHANRDLIFKQRFSHLDAERADFVLLYWPVDATDRASGWDILVGAAAAGANLGRVEALASKWHCDDTDATQFANRIGVTLRPMVGGGFFAEVAHPRMGDKLAAKVGEGRTALLAMASLFTALLTCHPLKVQWRYKRIDGLFAEIVREVSATGSR